MTLVLLALGFVAGFCSALLITRGPMRKVLVGAAARVAVAEKQVEKAQQKRKVRTRRLRKPKRATVPAHAGVDDAR